MTYEYLVREVQADGSIVYRTQDGTVIKVDEDLRLLIPGLKTDEFSTLTNNVREFGGVRDPIIVWRSDDPDLHGIIVDGMHRFAVATQLAVPIPYVYMDFPGYPDAKLWMIDNQRGRRNLTTGQKADLGVDAKIAYTEQAAARQRSGKALPDGVESADARDMASKLVGVGHNAIQLMEDIREVPVVHKLVKDNVLTVYAGHELIGLSEEQRTKLLTEVVDRTAKPRHNSEALKPHITAIKAQAIETAKAEAAVVKAETRDEQAIRDRFAQYFDQLVSGQPPKSVKTLTGQIAYYKGAAERRARILGLPIGVLETLTEILINNDKASQLRKLGAVTRGEDKVHKIRGDGSQMLVTPYTVDQLDTLILNGVEITEDTDIAAEALKIRLAISRQEEDARIKAMADRASKRLAEEEEERLYGSIRSRVGTNATQLGAAVRALKALQAAVSEERVYCPHHGPGCKFDMDKLAFECGTTLFQAAEDAAANIQLLAPKMEERTVTTTIKVPVYGGKSIEDKAKVTKLVRVDGDVGKLYREQP